MLVLVLVLSPEEQCTAVGRRFLCSCVESVCVCGSGCIIFARKGLRTSRPGTRKGFQPTSQHAPDPHARASFHAQGFTAFWGFSGGCRLRRVGRERDRACERSFLRLFLISSDLPFSGNLHHHDVRWLSTRRGKKRWDFSRFHDSRCSLTTRTTGLAAKSTVGAARW